MRMRSLWTALVTVVVLGQSGALWAADPAPTTITIPDMHCMGCAKKMANKLYEVPSVAKVQANVEATTLTVTPKAQQAPSPRALWEAVEKAGYKPSKLHGPSGTFTEKPKA
jgi:copper chaperone CopZ